MLYVVMQSVVMLIIVLLNVVMLNAVMLNVVMLWGSITVLLTSCLTGFESAV